MIQTALIQNAHADLVTDAAYDMYGLTLATCSLDQRIKIWVLENNGEWALEDDWKAHDATITKLSWAHPTFGTILASSSFDRSVKIWEQTHGETEPSSAHAHANGAKADGENSRWVERAVLLDAKGSVRAVEFSPHHFGMKLATVSSDNILRIYECLEQPALTSWQLLDDVEVPTLPSPGAPGSSTRAGTLAHTIAPGTPMPTGGGGSTLDGASVSNLLREAQQQQQQQAQQGVLAGRSGGAREADGGWCLSWCKERYWGEVLVVGCGTSGAVKIIQLSSHRRPACLLTLEPSPVPTAAPSNFRASGSRANSISSHSHPTNSGLPTTSIPSVPGQPSSGGEPVYSVTSVSWAPSCGRSFHLIATGSRDGHVRIWKVRPPSPSVNVLADEGGINGGFDDGGDEEMDTGESAEEKWSASLVAEFDDHKSSVGRVEWNITGTVLSSAGNDGKVRLWKQTVSGTWWTAGHISVEQEEEKSDDVDMDNEGR